MFRVNSPAVCAAMAQRVCSLARGRAVLVLEGGYNLERPFWPAL